MKQSWKPQYRSSLFANPLVWISVGIVLGLVLFGFYIVTKSPKVWVILGGYAFVVYALWEEARRWETYGYQKITIDSDNYKLIFDDSVEVPFMAISSVYLESEPVPPKPWWLRSRNDFATRLQEFNGLFVFNLSSGEVINFSVQNKYSANEINRALKKSNINTYMSDVTECHLNGTYQLAWIIGIVLVIAIGILFNYLK